MTADRNGKPPAITVRPATWEDYDWITSAADKRTMSRGEFLLLGALQRRHGGPMPQGRRAAAHAASSDEAKANVRPIPKAGKR